LFTDLAEALTQQPQLTVLTNRMSNWMPQATDSQYRGGGVARIQTTHANTPQRFSLIQNNSHSSNTPFPPNGISGMQPNTNISPDFMSRDSNGQMVYVSSDGMQDKGSYTWGENYSVPPEISEEDGSVRKSTEFSVPLKARKIIFCRNGDAYFTVS